MSGERENSTGEVLIRVPRDEFKTVSYWLLRVFYYAFNYVISTIGSIIKNIPIFFCKAHSSLNISSIDPEETSHPRENQGILLCLLALPGSFLFV